MEKMIYSNSKGFLTIKNYKLLAYKRSGQLTSLESLPVTWEDFIFSTNQIFDDNREALKIYDLLASNLPIFEADLKNQR